MWEKNLSQRFILIGAVLLIGLVLLFPYSCSDNTFRLNLRPGLDIAGGVAMIFEINEEGLENYPGNLAEDMKQLLQKRVDPQGVYGLEWRVHGRNRIEVQMPLPPADIKERRADYDNARQALYDTNVSKGDLEAALGLAPAERQARLAQLAGASAERQALLTAAAEASDHYHQAVAAMKAAEGGVAESQPASAPDLKPLRDAVRDAEEDLLDATDRVLATNFPVGRFEEALEKSLSTSPKAGQPFDRLKNDWLDVYPQLADSISNVVDQYNKWAEKRTFLDGPADLQRLLRGAGVLTFRILAEPSPENATKWDSLREQLAERGARGVRETGFAWFRVDNPVAFLNLDTPADLKDRDPHSFEASPYRAVMGTYDGDWYVLARTDAQGEMKGDSKRSWQLRNARADRDELGRPQVSFVFDVVGGNKFGELTGANVAKQLCIFVDDVAYSSANIREQIRTSGRITGDFSPQKVAYLVQTMQAGALPARLKDTPISERTLGSSLGAANLHMAFRAGIAGVIAVAIVMGVYYMLAGGIANVALLLNIVLVLAAMAMLQARVTLAGIAGVILTIGMSVDANVLIFERMREEKERGSSLRMIIKNGYDKAFSTIIDANITTLLTCIILYYVGSEEVKGFGLTLGWGIVISLFTALFVTRTIFAALLHYHLITDIKMFKLIGVPKIDWYAKRKFFVPVSAILILAGCFLLYERGLDALDVEFRGGVSAELELKQNDMVLPGNGSTEVAVNDIRIRDAITSVAAGVSADAENLVDAQITAVPDDPRLFVVGLEGVSAARLAALLTEPLEDAGLLARGGVDTTTGSDEISVRVQEDVDADKLKAFVAGYAKDAKNLVGRLSNVNVSRVIETDKEGLIWSITTTETNKRLVQYVLEVAMGDNLQRQPAISHQLRHGMEPAYPVTSRRLGEVVPGLPEAVSGRDVTKYLDGAALHLDELSPPVSIEAMTLRLRNMRLQPDFQDLPWRDFEVLGVAPTGEKDLEGHDTYTGVVILVVDPEIAYSRDPEEWAAALAEPEVKLAEDTLGTEQSLRKVSQFKPQVAEQSQVRALMALLLSWGMIIAYMWLRFGRVTYGVAGVVALVHDVLIALAFVGISGWIGGQNHPIGEFFLIEDFHINMTIVAAFLTIIGYSINDTIVVFDRIRETRGRLGVVTPEIINSSINQCLSRTILTSATTLIVLVTMYIFGGGSIRGFNFCMIIGILTGTYSSIAIAAPLLMIRGQRVTARGTVTSAKPV
ncbi:MAG: protein translocase subunit SecD [Phycisphaerae bacterium]|nr:protein translocase subunit SecD [Phycisphaerae bacterium]